METKERIAPMEETETVTIDLDFIKDGVAYRSNYDGIKDDLLSGGLGKSGLETDLPPLNYSDDDSFRRSLRTRTLYNNYRALVDMSAKHPTDYYGRIYGPGVGTGGGEGLISGDEYIALTEDRVTMMVQIPETFDVNNPRIITAPSSGSRGVYGAIGTAGEWGLKRGFAVAYTDKGTGIGFHNLMKDSVNLVTGERIRLTGKTERAQYKNRANFIAVSENDDIREKVLNEFNTKYKHRFAFKHAHSGKNFEKDWGTYVLQSIEFAIHILNIKYNKGKKIFNAKNTLVIASSVSNGGGASIRAAEQDTEGLIDGVAVAEPNVCPEYNNSFTIQQGEKGTPFENHSKNLLEYTTLLNIYQPCASLAKEFETAPYNVWCAKGTRLRQYAENRCKSLYDKGLLKSNDLTLDDFNNKSMTSEYIKPEGIEKLAIAAQKEINNFGILSETNVLQPSHCYFDVYRSIAIVYANQYGKYNVTDNLCGYSFGATRQPNGKEQDYNEGKPTMLNFEDEDRLFSDLNGIPPCSPINLINNDSLDGHMEDRLSISPSTKRRDLNLDGALRLHDLVNNSKKNCSDSKRVLDGIEEVRATGDLNGLPTIIVTGRDDAVIPPNHASRAYFGLNRIKEGQKSNLHYYEVTKAHHLDSFNKFYASYGKFYTPLHYYFTQSLDLMYSHLTKGTPLPESQVIKTSPPGSDYPDILENPDAEKICFEAMCVRIPE